MPQFNDIDLNNWKNADIETDSLWLINSRDNSGKHDGFYHGNFVPQVPRQLIKRYTKSGDIVFDPFVGSGTTLFETENLKRDFIGIDIQPDLIEYIKQKSPQADVICGDSSDNKTFDYVKDIIKKRNKEKIQLAILHPPYFDIIKFSENKNDLSNTTSLENFRKQFKLALHNTIDILENKRYLAIVIGDKYQGGEWIPLGFYLMQDAMEKGLKLKSIVVKNMSGNRAKQHNEAIWKYRALSSDYYIFKHEYVMIFKKEER